MKQNFRSLYLMGTLLFSTLIFSCNKEVEQKNDQPDEQSLSVARETVNVYAVLNGAFTAILSGSIPSDGKVSGRKFGCANITANPGGLTGYPKDILVDFGTEDCTLRGYTGNGSVSFTLNQWIYEPGAVIEPVFNNFYVNGYKVEGTYKITTEAADKFKVEIIEGIITSESGAKFELTGEQYYTQIEGGNTPIVFGDDVFSITGEVDGVSMGLPTKGHIKTPLIRAVDCDNISAGVLYVEAGEIVGDLDFGDGTCDNEGILTTTLAGQVFEIPMTLPF